jgi:hypothetical protein
MSEIDDREEKEAAALRRAIEEGVAEKDLPSDALEAAALLRYGARGGAIDPAADQRILGELLELSPRRVLKPRRAWLWIAPLGAATAAATFLIFWPAQIPAPPIALLRAQAAAAGGDASAVALLEKEMRAYRRRILIEVAQK